MLKSIEDHYWSNVEFANGFYNVLSPLDYLIEKQERKELMETLLGLPVQELNALMFISYEENTFTTLARLSNVSTDTVRKRFHVGLNRLRRRLKNNHNWDLGTI